MSVKLCDRKGVTVFPRRGVTPSSKGFAHTFKERSTRPILRTSAVMNMWGHARNTGGPTRMEIRFGRRIRPLVKSYPALNVNRWANPEINRSLTRSAKMCPGKSATSSMSKNATQFPKSFAKTYPERSAELFLSKNARLFTPEFRKVKQRDGKWLHVTTTSTTLTSSTIQSAKRRTSNKIERGPIKVSLSSLSLADLLAWRNCSYHLLIPN